MASLVQPFINNLQSISDRLPELARQAIESKSEEVLDILRHKQLGLGFNSAGNRLEWDSGDGFYKPSTEMFAAISSPPPRTPKRRGQAYTFQWSGSTFDSMEIKHLAEGAFHIFTADGKQNLLESIYGEIFQLTPEHNEYVNNEIILPYLQKYVLDNLFNV